MQIANEPPEPGLELFVPQFIKDRLTEIQELLESKNMKNIQLKAHEWKGFSAPYGFSNLERMARTIEESNLETCITILIQAQNYCLERQKLLGNV